MKLFTKDSLISDLKQIRDQGWIQTARRGNDGGVGNTLEDLLGIEENNLPLPNAGEWEIKGQRSDTNSLITLFHMEPSPRAIRFVPQVLLPHYGWGHKEAGSRHPYDERSFRQTLTAGQRTNRGFTVIVNRERGRVEVSFDKDFVTPEQSEWLSDVEDRIGLGELNPQPYWGFNELFHKAGTKLGKTVYAIAERNRVDGHEFFRYTKFLMLEQFQLSGFLDAVEEGDVLVDFDARTGHNHGTKFRLRQDSYPSLYDSIVVI